MIKKDNLSNRYKGQKAKRHLDIDSNQITNFRRQHTLIHISIYIYIILYPHRKIVDLFSYQYSYIQLSGDFIFFWLPSLLVTCQNPLCLLKNSWHRSLGWFEDQVHISPSGSFSEKKSWITPFQHWRGAVIHGLYRATYGRVAEHLEPKFRPLWRGHRFGASRGNNTNYSEASPPSAPRCC